MPQLLVRLLFPLVLCLCVAQDAEVVAEFRKYFRKYKDTPTRVEAVLALQGCESPLAVEALREVVKAEEPEVARAAVRVLSTFKSRPPVDALLADLAASKDPFWRSILLEAVADGGYKETSAAIQPLLKDKAWTVRRRAVQALAGAKEPGAAEALAPLLTDSEPAVRSATLDGLAALKSELVLQPAIAALGDEVWQVRASAIHALKSVRHRDSIGPLIERLAVEEGRLRADIGDALYEITGRKYGQNLEGWRSFWSGNEQRFVIPTDAELAKLRARAAEIAAEYKPQGAVQYHGIDTPSRSILFVIDVSGSMEALVVEKERFKDGGYPSMMRMDICKTELIRTIEKLEGYVQFNIFAFATDVKGWKKAMVPANVVNKSAAVEWVRRLEPIGGSSKEDLARVGLVGAANLEAGKTNTFGALTSALDVGGKGGAERGYQVAVDTIFFLSDGRPTHGEYVDTDDIRREIRVANELRKVVIHTIAIGEFQKDFMRQLAEENGGVFVDLGR